MSDQLCFRHSTQIPKNQRANFDKHFISFATDNGMVLDKYETRCFGIDREDPVHLSFVGFIFIVFLLVTAAAIYYYRRHKRLQVAARDLVPLRLRPARDNDV